MIKLSLSPDLRFANDKLVNRKATVTLGDEEFKGTFSIMPASASTQAAITAEVYLEEDKVITADDLSVADTNKVELKANVIKTVHFKKGQTTVDTGLVLKEGESFKADGYEIAESSHKTLTISRAAEAAAEAETAEVELYIEVTEGDQPVPAGIPVATGRLVGNTMGFVIKAGKEAVRIHALCNWVGYAGLKKNLESFKMVRNDHDAIVLSLATNSADPSKSLVVAGGTDAGEGSDET